jgi:hypothetical protein
LDPIDLEYRHLLALSAKLPLAWGAELSRLRGLWLARTDRDWRSLALGTPYVYDKTHHALEQILAQRTKRMRQISSNVHDSATTELGSGAAKSIATERFVFAAFEEWQAALIQANKLDGLTFDGETTHAMLPKHAVFATMHMDSPMLGLVQLGRWGRPLCALSSNVFEDQRVHPSIQDFFRAKYRAMSLHWHGGRCMHKESELTQFLRAGSDGFSLAVFCDVPGTRNKDGGDKGVWVNFLGERRLVAPAVFRIAQRLSLPIVAMCCERVSDSRYQVHFSDPIPSDDIEAACEPLYAFWTDKIFSKPQSWWASDLLLDFPIDRS